MSKKILYIASAASHIVKFHNEYLKNLQDFNYEIHAAAGGDVSDIDKINASKNFVLNFEKNKGLFKNIAVIYKLHKIINREKYDIISTQSTLAGFAGRVAVFFNEKIKVFHTCHGYLFNDDNSIKSKIMILIEKILSRKTDLLFVMNQDDYDIAKKYKLCKNIRFINGMGLNPSKFSARSEIDIFEKYKILQNKKYFLCIGEFSKRKSQRDIIFALKSIKNTEDLHVIFLGNGVLLDECKKLCETFGIQNIVTFCGHVSNPKKFYELAYCVISASRFEGLPFNILEALYVGKPVIASNVKGHKDLIKHNFNGYLFDYGECEKLSELIETILIDENYNKLKKNVVLDDKYMLENIKQGVLEEYINC